MKFNKMKQRIAWSLLMSNGLVLVACQSPAPQVNTPSQAQSPQADFVKQDTSSSLTAPPLGMHSKQKLTAPPLGLTAPPLGLQPELALVSFSQFDTDNDQRWNLNELDLYLEAFSANDVSGFSTKATTKTQFNAALLMQTFDTNNNQFLELQEAKALHLSLYAQT